MDDGSFSDSLCHLLSLQNQCAGFRSQGAPEWIYHASFNPLVNYIIAYYSPALYETLMKNLCNTYTLYS